MIKNDLFLPAKLIESLSPSSSSSPPEREELERIEQEQREEEEREYQEKLQKLEEQERKQRARQQEIEERESRREEERRVPEEKPATKVRLASPSPLSWQRIYQSYYGNASTPRKDTPASVSDWSVTHL